MLVLLNGSKPILAKHNRVNVFLCILIDGGVLIPTKFIAKRFFLDNHNWIERIHFLCQLREYNNTASLLRLSK
jgi:hypothetical protein